MYVPNRVNQTCRSIKQSNKDKSTSEMRFISVCAILFAVWCCIFAAEAQADDALQAAARAAIRAAEQTLLNQMGTPSMPEFTLAGHSYVKLTELTEMIGFESNKNILAFQDLQRQGFQRTQILSTLSEERPPICTEVPTCDPDYPYRSINGTCNNLAHPIWGSILTPFTRLRGATYADGFNEQRGGRNIASSRLPNVRVVSSSIHDDLIQPDSSITNMVAQFGQFLDHDLTLTPEGDKPCCTTALAEMDCWSIPIHANDSFYSNRLSPQTCLDFTRSTPYCFPTPSGVREQMNILTAFVDASMLYGSDDEREFHLRQFERGRLRVNGSNPNLLPTVAEVEDDIGEPIEFMGDFLAGDDRVNEMPALATMHTLMVREHNRVADEIYARRPSWSDEIIFQETRRVVIAEWQNIVYAEYLPVILGPTTTAAYRIQLPSNPAEYTHYNSRVEPTINHEFATAAYRFGHTLINGLVRLMQGLVEVGSYQVRDNFFLSDQVTQEGGMGYDLILGGLMTQNAQTYDQHVTEDLSNFLLRDRMNDFGSDLISRNLQRARDHALASYNEYRKHCSLTGLTNWNARPVEIRPEVWQMFQSLYDLPSDIDLFSAGISEFPVPDGVTGPTFNCIKAGQFATLKDGDRFFFTHQDQPKPFTPAQLVNLRGRTLGDLICENSRVEATPFNVFRTEEGFAGVPNPRIECDDPSRTRLNFDELVGVDDS